MMVRGQQQRRVEKWLDSGCTLKVEPTSLADGLKVGYNFYFFFVLFF